MSQDELSEGDRAFALTKYASDRAHELELDRITSAYELAFYRGLFVLNGGAAAALLAFFASTLKDSASDKDLVWLALVFWMGGMLVAGIAGSLAYNAQKKFVGALRSKRHALARRIIPKFDPVVHGTLESDTSDRLLTTAAARQLEADREWKDAHRIGWLSILLFAVGVFTAASALF